MTVENVRTCAWLTSARPSGRERADLRAVDQRARSSYGRARVLRRRAGVREEDGRLIAVLD